MDDFAAALLASRIPSYMHGGLVRHVVSGLPVGDFLYAVLTNNLKQSILHADDENRRLLPEYVLFLMNHVPSQAWGDPSRVTAWCKQGGLEGQPGPGDDHKRGIDAHGWGDGAEAAR